ncbi:MAG: glycosyltransferase [Bacteroidetes bacterium]|nr:glycosyltransferase [Bacteroidota bacterium]
MSRVLYWGPGWQGFDESKTLKENISSLHTKINYIICYKAENIHGIDAVSIPKCITYNEMYDIEKTVREINNIKPNLVVCHHENDLIFYKKNILKKINCYVKFIHIPHCAEKSIFFDKNENRSIDILLCGVIGQKFPIKKRIYAIPRLIYQFIKLTNPFIQNPENKKLHFEKFKMQFIILKWGYSNNTYPLRQRYRKVLKQLSINYNCVEYLHPGYIKSDASTDIYAKEFASALNQSKICLTCTSKFKYRLAKMVEIPMCGATLACDVPNQDQATLKDIMIDLDPKMSNSEIAKKLKSYLENPIKLENTRQRGISWSKKYDQEYYAKSLLAELTKLDTREISIYVHSEKSVQLKSKWICDVLKSEFLKYANVKIVDSANFADIIWLLAPWAHKDLDMEILKSKFIVTTIHHIDPQKYNSNKSYFKLIDGITNRYHTICDPSLNELKKITSKQIVVANFWINEKNFFEITDIKALKIKHNLPQDSFLIGSFQKDSEGRNLKIPKLSKGPDLFIKIISEIRSLNPNIHVVLTGWRRNYMINELNKLNISFSYYELIDTSDLNELYNCLDLYLVTSRVEGGPRAILECGLVKTPLISTRVGISELILHQDSIFDMNKIMTYKLAKPNIEHANKNAQKFSIPNYMDEFASKVFYESLFMNEKLIYSKNTLDK